MVSQGIGSGFTAISSAAPTGWAAGTDATVKPQASGYIGRLTDSCFGIWKAELRILRRCEEERLSALDEALTHSDGYGRRAGRNAELAENIPDVRVDRAATDEERVRDRLI